MILCCCNKTLSIIAADTVTVDTDLSSLAEVENYTPGTDVCGSKSLIQTAAAAAATRRWHVIFRADGGKRQTSACLTINIIDQSIFLKNLDC